MWGEGISDPRVSLLTTAPSPVRSVRQRFSPHATGNSRSTGLGILFYVQDNSCET